MSNNQYFITYNALAATDDVSNVPFDVWSVNTQGKQNFTKLPSNAANVIPNKDHLVQVGNYLLQWSPLNKSGYYDYRLFEFNPTATNALGSYDSSGNWTTAAVQYGSWQKSKYFGSRSDFANAGGAQKGYESGTDLILLSVHNFLLNWIPTEGRGTYQLFNFDHMSKDPLPNTITPQGGWLTINTGHELLHSNGYIIDWQSANSDYAIWQFDAQSPNPLSYPAATIGNWKDLGIDANHQLSALGSYILDTNVTDNSYRIWLFDQYSKNPLQGPVASGNSPSDFGINTQFVPIETLIEVDASKVNTPGTIDFMRDKIEHVVYYMIENRSLDHVCGWLYDNKDKINVIGPKGSYRGVDPNFINVLDGKSYAITQYNDGKLSNDPPFQLDLDEQDPYHDNSDVLRQLFSTNIQDYFDKKVPDMGGFAWNNGTEEVMLGYSPEQLPVLNGLAKNFAISDAWHCSMPGGTDVNRAFALTGSTLGQLNNFQNGDQYTEWADYPHRPSIWKTLWSNGISDFKIYNSVEWFDCKFTYNLFLKGQIPYVDGPFSVGSYAPQINQFFDDLKYGTLPKFSFLEPKWVASAGSTSYHPGNDLIPGERALKDIFDAIQDSPVRDKTLLVITFDEHGGLPDHVPPPYATKPYANDSIEGFDFDLMGVRIPTIMTSSYIKKKTVFRSDTGIDYDSTSILSTLLQWFGIPKSRWGMGERTNMAPSFENILQEKTARKDKVRLKVPYDSLFPEPQGDETPKVNATLKVHDLHRLLIPRMIKELTPKMDKTERAKIIDEVMNNAKTQDQLIQRLNHLHNSKK